MCSLLDVPCHLGTMIAPYWTWIVWGFWILVALAGLLALAKIKELFGWPGVFAVLSLGAYSAGYVRGRDRKSFNPIENVPEDSPDARPVERRPRNPPAEQRPKTIMDMLKRWQKKRQ